MTPRVVLVTGVRRDLAAQLAARLCDAPGVERVIGVDTAPPRPELFVGHAGSPEFVRADIRNPLIAKVLDRAAVDTVVHLGIGPAVPTPGGRAAAKETNVIGTMQLLAACQRAAAVRTVVFKSTTAAYGSSPRNPAIFTEDTEPWSGPRPGFARDAVEAEEYARGFARRRPDVAVRVLRCAEVIGPRLDTPLTTYFSLPAVPVLAGFDPRLQLLHEEDAVAALRIATEAPGPAARGYQLYNVAGAGVLLLSQAIRRAGRVPVPLPGPALGWLRRAARRVGAVDFSADQLSFLPYGGCVDTARAAGALGFRPRYSTADAFDDFVRGRNLASPLSPVTVERVERALLDLAGAGARARGK